MLYLIPVACFLIPLILGYLLTRYRMGRLALVLGAAAALVVAWALWRGEHAQGWDGLGYAIFAIGVALPVSLGFFAGSGVSWWRRRRARRG